MKKGLTGICSGCILIFYICIVLYVFFAILKINTLANFESAMMFEIIGFLLLAYFVIDSLLLKSIKTGFLVPLIIVTIAYTIILDVINIALVAAIPQTIFIFLNLVLLFIYCLISMPMHIIGRR